MNNITSPQQNFDFSNYQTPNFDNILSGITSASANNGYSPSFDLSKIGQDAVSGITPDLGQANKGILGSFYNEKDGINFKNLGNLASFGTNLFGAYLANQANNDNRRALNFQIDAGTKGFNNNVAQVQAELNDRAARRAADAAASGLTPVTGPAAQLSTIGSSAAPQSTPVQQTNAPQNNPNNRPQYSPLSSFGVGG